MTQFAINGLVAGSLYAIVGLSFALIYNPTRFFHFAHGAILAWGAYFAYTGSVLLGLPLGVSVVVAIALTAGLGTGLAVAVYGPLRQRSASSVVLLLASLGLYLVLQNMISLVYGDATRTLRGVEATVGYAVFGGRVTAVQLCIVFAGLACFAFVWPVICFTKTGKAMRAVAIDPELAGVSGIYIETVVLCAFGFGSGLAGFAGVLIALDVGMTPTMGMHALLMGVVAAIIGGIRSIPGIAAGAMLLAMAQNLGAWKVSTEWQDVIAFVVLLGFLMLRPEGFWGRSLKKAVV